MDNSRFMCLHNLLRQKKTRRQVPCLPSGHIIALYAVYSRILVGILLLTSSLLHSNQA